MKTKVYWFSLFILLVFGGLIGRNINFLPSKSYVNLFPLIFFLGICFSILLGSEYLKNAYQSGKKKYLAIELGVVFSCGYFLVLFVGYTLPYAFNTSFISISTSEFIVSNKLKHASKNRCDFSIQLEATQTFTKNDHLCVPQKLFDSLSLGDTLIVNGHQSALGIAVISWPRKQLEN